MLSRILATLVMMVGPPSAPSTRNSFPSFKTMVGVMAESGRFPGPGHLVAMDEAVFKEAVAAIDGNGNV